MKRSGGTVRSASEIRRRLKLVASRERAVATQRFFKTGPGEYGEGDRFLGVPVPELRRVSREFQDIGRSALVALLQSPWHEERLLALLIMVRQFTKGDDATRQELHELYVEHLERVNNWDLVDLSSEHLIGAHLARGNRALLARLVRSPIVWERRIAVLATFHFIKRGEFSPTLTLARRLLNDRHDLIHKAVGWMLREIGQRDPLVARRFLDAHAHRMPRTMLRYAMERFPEPLRRRYLAK